MPNPFTLPEQESIARWDASSPTLTLYTASPAQAAKWRKLGYPLKPMRHHAGEPTGWQCVLTTSCLKFRKWSNGQVVKRKGGGNPLALQAAREARQKATPTSTA